VAARPEDAEDDPRRTKAVKTFCVTAKSKLIQFPLSFSKKGPQTPKPYYFLDSTGGSEEFFFSKCHFLFKKCFFGPKRAKKGGPKGCTSPSCPIVSILFFFEWQAVPPGKTESRFPRQRPKLTWTIFNVPFYRHLVLHFRTRRRSRALSEKSFVYEMSQYCLPPQRLLFDLFLRSFFKENNEAWRLSSLLVPWWIS
jgi:hypothetical protein